MNNFEDYQFPLSVQDMNDEIIAKLDDESLYQLCQTNKRMAKTCLSKNIWIIRANSPLASLYIVRNQYKNWMDFYANIRKDYLYCVIIRDVRSRGIGITSVFTNIREALLVLLGDLNLLSFSFDEAGNVPIEQLKLIITNPGHIGPHDIGLVTLIHKNTIYDKNNMGEHILYSINGSGDSFLNPAVLTFPDLMDVPVMQLFPEPKSGIRTMFAYADFSALTLLAARLLPEIGDYLHLAFNGWNLSLMPMGLIGWQLEIHHNDAIVGGAIVDGAALNIEGISTDKYHIVYLPVDEIYQGIVYEFSSLAYNARRNIPGAIDKLRWYITTFGTFFKLEDITAFLSGNLITSL